ncbi:MAG: hypothetical protein KBS55_05030 [Bacteroidales bacterium]|nr:hypothetical protein [Candidatus Cryptobacteroides aphodequi]
MTDKTKKVWLIARAMPCQERKAEEELNALGCECYVPVQKVKRRWSDRWKIIDKLVIRVVVTDGPLKGGEYELVNVMGKTCIGVFLGSFSATTVEFSTSNLRLISKN